MDERKSVYSSPVKTTKFVNVKFAIFPFFKPIFMPTAAVWYSVQVSQSWSCWGIQDTSPPARAGWRIYWNALVPQSHIPVIDLLKHYHSRLGLLPSPHHHLSPCFDQWRPPPPSPLQLQWDKSQMTCSEKKRRWLVFLNQARSNFSTATIIIAIMGITILLIRGKKRWRSELTLSDWNPQRSALDSSAV